MSKSRREIEALIEALDDAPIDEEQARETVSQLGIDVSELAGRLRMQVAQADARERETRIHEARKAYAAEVEALERRRISATQSRDEQLTMFRALLSKVPPQQVAVHFHKYESATDEELAELIRALRHLLGEDEPE
ncbi:hypothetical protein AKJ09_04083 [Labilithrix luteola]|uniref:Uncharacterized protein n=1 Tax=Labilithrix luteola TaxID=1391654 RepID=A0A0K1PWA1_9BACT|nr:hypothetical protein [Labilithrix luteola]AKU97419.1 hypothetical protein AKJ09_04083 [Labilithrix luteola]